MAKINHKCIASKGERQKQGTKMKKISIWAPLALLLVCAGCASSGEGPAEAQPGADREMPAETVYMETPSAETPVQETTALESPPAQTPAPETAAPEGPNGKRIEPFEAICQYPELPTGCEMTSLAMALNYSGVPADKCDIADNYLDKGEVGTVDFRAAFAGDPRDESSYGCYAPVVVNAANRYLQAAQSTLRAEDLSGTEFEELFPYIDAGIPVIVWGTQDCAEGHYSVTWNVNGVDLTWYTPEHCMVLVGYEESLAWVADPIYGDVRSYDRETFKSRYEALYRQAVVIR